ncbi:hypothetical protein D9M68_695370 [compost metagenome]
MTPLQPGQLGLLLGGVVLLRQPETWLHVDLAGQRIGKLRWLHGAVRQFPLLRRSRADIDCTRQRMHMVLAAGLLAATSGRNTQWQWLGIAHRRTATGVAQFLQRASRGPRADGCSSRPRQRHRALLAALNSH